MRLDSAPLRTRSRLLVVQIDGLSHAMLARAMAEGAMLSDGGDLTAHAFGPHSRRALRALRHVDRSIHQLWRVLRRVPEYRYDLCPLGSRAGRVRQLP